MLHAILWLILWLAVICIVLGLAVVVIRAALHR